MSRGVNINGRYTRNPGVYASPEYRVGSSANALQKRITVVGSFPFLEQYKPSTSSSQVSLERLSPRNLDLKRLSSLLYSSMSDPSVAGAPSSVTLINTRPSTRGGIAVTNAAGDHLFTVYASAYGSAGARTIFTFARTADTGDDAPYPVVYDITTSYEGVSETLRATADKLIEIVYSGSAFFAAGGVKASFDPDGELLIYGSKTGVPAGALIAVGDNCVGGVTVEPSVAPGAGASYSFKVSGLDETGVEYDEILEWAEGDGDSKTTSPFSFVTSVTPAASAGTPTFSMSFSIYSRSASDMPTVSEVSDEISALAHLSGTSCHEDLGSVFRINSLDKLDSTACDSAQNGGVSGLALTNALASIFSALDSSSVVTYEAATSLGKVVHTAGTTAIDQYLSGGYDGAAETSLDYTEALRAAEKVDCEIVLALSESESVGLAVREHCKKMSGVGASERWGVVGTEKSLTISGVRARVRRLNTRHVSLVCQEIKVYSPLGSPEWLSPKWTAALVAGGRASAVVAGSLTKKYANVIDIRQHSSWNPEDDLEEALEAQFTMLEPSDNGIRVCRDYTTHVSDSSPEQTEASCNESVNYCLRNVRQALTEVADSAPPQLLITATTQVLDELLAAGVISDYVRSSVSVSQSGDIYVVAFDFSPTYRRNFTLVIPRVLRRTVTIGAVASQAA